MGILILQRYGSMQAKEFDIRIAEYGVEVEQELMQH
jgi:hypothetical protein